MDKIYIVEFADYDGYNQRFVKVGGWEDVVSWAKDGSIRKDDVVFELKPAQQPKIKNT